MHAEAMGWLTEQAATLTDVDTVIDLGGRNINGTPRGLWPAADYTVIDLHPGPGVDVVADCRDWAPDDKVDLVVCAEVLEHTDDVPGVLEAAAGWLRQGGTLLVTAAAEPRAPHSHHDGGPLQPGEHYQNVTRAALADALAHGWYDPEIIHDEVHGDIYCRVQRR
ncbi:class I SAM-dependent methyltransferase [Klenkia brasiliensis]|uniref:Methyltransferase domain-containing protein n=1 Tax=Klenkia brasiliensis TaxID=333142 RepID=A0A1G7YFS0_9ACTN|nr:methyltransferase domain-containing protein [Klenkia brasiliensis]SDG95214.1 Methyltransferase domain-containing protein [Klenkia brasiliensis]